MAYTRCADCGATENRFGFRFKGLYPFESDSSGFHGEELKAACNRIPEECCHHADLRLANTPDGYWE